MLDPFQQMLVRHFHSFRVLIHYSTKHGIIHAFLMKGKIWQRLQCFGFRRISCSTTWACFLFYAEHFYFTVPSQEERTSSSIKVIKYSSNTKF